MTYDEYPMVMTHPNAQAAKIEKTEGQDLKGRFTDYGGTPATLQPVTVNDEDQRQQYEAKGYRPAGTPDASAYISAASPAPSPDYQPAEYPKWVQGVIVNSREDELAKFPPAKPEPDLSRHKPRSAGGAL
jgi:hypothetical protein